MAPWKELEWFDSPRETLFSNAGGGIEVFNLEANPRRIGLLFATNTNTFGNARITTSSNTGAGSGVVLLNTQSPFVLTHKDTPTLVQSAWNIVLNISTSVTTFEILLREWPPEPKANGGVAEILSYLRSLFGKNGAPNQPAYWSPPNGMVRSQPDKGKW